MIWCIWKGSQNEQRGRERLTKYVSSGGCGGRGDGKLGRKNNCRERMIDNPSDAKRKRC